MPGSFARLAVAATLFAALSLPARADYYGAIAYSTGSGAVGYSYDYGSRYAAEARALNECGGGCFIATWFRNACGALAVGPRGWGAAWANSRSGAERAALGYCAQNTAGCYVKRWVCTTR